MHIQLWKILLFSDDATDKVLCKLDLKESDITKLRDAIEDLYYFEFVIGKYIALAGLVECCYCCFVLHV
jgi:hypothetical protein